MKKNQMIIKGLITLIFITSSIIYAIPVFKSKPKTAAFALEPYIYEVNASGTGNLTYSLSLAPYGMSIDETTGKIHWIPVHNQAGDNKVSIKVQDDTGSSLQDFTIFVLGITDAQRDAMKEVHSKFTGTKYTLLTVGDSISYTSATWRNLKWGIVNHPIWWFYNKISGWDWKGAEHCNYSGWTAGSGLSAIDGALTKDKPETVTILYGANDAPGVNVDTYKSNMIGIVEKCLARSTIVILITPAYKSGVNMVPYVNKIKEISQEGVKGKKIPLIDFYAFMLHEQPDNPAALLSDGVHPNIAGKDSNDLGPDATHKGGYNLLNHLIWDMYNYVHTRGIVPGTNCDPIASFTVTPQEGNIGTEFTMDASSSSDPEGRNLKFRWDFENDGIWDTSYSTDSKVKHTYKSGGLKTILLEVQDSAGSNPPGHARSNFMTIQVTVSQVAIKPNVWSFEVSDVGKLLSNYPNPFNPECWIPYVIGKAELKDVKIRIYNILGQIVRELNLGNKSEGKYLTKDKAAYWDGKNINGKKVGSGVYFYELIIDGKVIGMKKGIVLK